MKRGPSTPYFEIELTSLAQVGWDEEEDKPIEDWGFTFRMITSDGHWLHDYFDGGDDMDATDFSWDFITGTMKLWARGRGTLMPIVPMLDPVLEYGIQRVGLAPKNYSIVPTGMPM